MDYEQKYKEALSRAKDLMTKQNPPAFNKDLISLVFPELNESEGDKIRKVLLDYFQSYKEVGTVGAETFNGIPTDNILAWLEKQEEPEDKGEISDGYHTFNELYRYRMLYNAAFFNLLPKYMVHKSKRHHDGEECFGGGWFIVMANLPAGQISNHYELKDWDLFQIPEKDVADEWDGHTPQEAAERLHKYLLEKQGDQEPADNVEPKFKVGDIVQYITDSTDRRKIEEIDTLCNMYHTDSSPIMFEIEDEWKVVVNAEDVEQESVDKVDFEKKELKKIEYKTLDPEKVIEWLKTKVYDDSAYGMAMIEQFKKDFEI